jgi:hypothetical protein
VTAERLRRSPELAGNGKKSKSAFFERVVDREGFEKSRQNLIYL